MAKKKKPFAIRYPNNMMYFIIRGIRSPLPPPSLFDQNRNTYRDKYTVKKKFNSLLCSDFDILKLASCDAFLCYTNSCSLLKLYSIPISSYHGDQHQVNFIHWHLYRTCWSRTHWSISDIYSVSKAWF